MTEKKVAAVGFCCADVYENLGEWYPTGNGIDWGIHLRRMGVPVSVVSVVGNDTYGEGMKRILSEENIDISHLRTEEGTTCPVSYTHLDVYKRQAECFLQPGSERQKSIHA